MVKNSRVKLEREREVVFFLYIEKGREIVWERERAKKRECLLGWYFDV